jgi:hypothetical protein
VLQIVLIAAAVSALPHFDVERLCHASGLFNTGDKSEQYKLCASGELAALSKLQKKWAQYPAKIRNECADMVRVAPGSSYVDLEVCIETANPEIRSGAAPAKPHHQP